MPSDSCHAKFLCECISPGFCVGMICHPLPLGKDVHNDPQTSNLLCYSIDDFPSQVRFVLFDGDYSV